MLIFAIFGISDPFQRAIKKLVSLFTQLVWYSLLLLHGTGG